MKLAFILLALLAALVAVHGETKATTTVVGATGTTAGETTVPAVVKAGIPISVGNLTTISGTTGTMTVQGATTGVTVSGTGATGSFVGQPTIVGSTGATVAVSTAVATPAASAAATSSPAASRAATISLVSTSPAASGAATISIVSASPAASGAAVISSASPAASGAATISIVSASPAASGAAVIVSASPAASGAAAISSASPAASGAAVVTVVSASPSVSGAASPTASRAASPTTSLAASPAASAVAAASPAISGAASPLASASPGALVSAANLYPAMPTYGEENFQFTCPNATTQAMVEVSLEPLLIGLGDVSSIKFAGCPSLMYVATRAGQIFEVTINNSTSAVEQVRLILDLSSQIPSSSSGSASLSGGASTAAGASSASASASTSSSAASSSNNPADQPGLLGMAFPPDFANTGLFYVYFSTRSSSGTAATGGGGASATVTTGGASATTAGGATAASPSSSSSSLGAMCGNESTMLDHVNRLAEYRLNSSSGIATFSRTLLDLRWPFANDNGDNPLEFAPESMLLFLGVGDGGSSFDPFENAQNPDILLGKVQVLDLNRLSANASCNATVLRLSELERECSEIAGALTTFASGMHAPAGFEFLNPSAGLEAASCPGGANATAAGGANATAAGGANATAAGGANATAAGGANATAAGGANATAGGANATAAGGANATSANATTSAGGANRTLSDLAPRLIAPDRGQGQYDEINIMEQIGANYGWDIIQGWTCVNQSLELCPQSTSGAANASQANATAAGGGAGNQTLAGGANASTSANATAGGGASLNSTSAGGANASASTNATAGGGAANATSGTAVLPAAVLPHNCRQLYNPQAILGGRLYLGSQLDPLLQGAYIFGATTSLQNGNESLPTGNGALYFMRPESFSGNAEVDLSMCPAATAGGANASSNASQSSNQTLAGGGGGGGGANASSNATQSAGGANATATSSNATSSANASLSGITVTGSGVNTSFIPNSRLEVFPVTINYQFFPTQHFFTAVGADSARTQLFLGVSSAQGGSNTGGVFRLIPFNEGAQNPAVISSTNLRPGQIVFSANATASASPSPSASASRAPTSA